MNRCITGKAYICKDWTNETDWFKRKYVTFCTKCGRRVIYNNKTYRYNHINIK